MPSERREDLVGFLRKAQAGDRNAFSEIVKRMMKPVVAMIYRMTQDRDSAVDLAQDTFVSAWENLPTFRGESKFESWLFAIASNRTLNYLKSRSVRDRRELDEQAVAEFSTENPETDLARKELHDRVLSFMTTLPEQQRLVFNLRFYRQMPFEEIARVTGKALGTVKTHYREAVKKLREVAIERGWHS
jgi:RNA polymerase sigma-70 factor (ECF subfamily)